MDIDIRHLTGLIVIASSAAVLGMSYLGVYLLGKNAVHKEIERRDAFGGSRQPDRLDRIETAVDSIAIEVERLSEGQRFLLGSRQPAQPAAAKQERRHATPV